MQWKGIILPPCVLFVLFSVSVSLRPDNSVDSHELFNRCLDGENHKRKPGPEDSLHKQCSPWANRSCCTEDTAQLIHTSRLYNFDRNHCKAENKTLSEKCDRHFVQDHCFFECSPNVGPWLVGISGMKTRNESLFEVPLCASECDNWFKDCKDDYTCTDNWMTNFDWKKPEGQKKKKNVCPEGSKCQTFQQIYKTAENFCQTVWNGAYKYTSDEQPCMKIWFEGEKNPNDDVARWKIDQMFGDHTNSGSIPCPVWSVVLLFALKNIWSLVN